MRFLVKFARIPREDSAEITKNKKKKKDIRYIRICRKIAECREPVLTGSLEFSYRETNNRRVCLSYTERDESYLNRGRFGAREEKMERSRKCG